MVFAFNCFSVGMLYVELARYFLKDHIPQIRVVFDQYFKSFCDAREQNKDAFIITHILLLMGCAMPPTIMFMIVRGGFLDGHWRFLSLAGLVYLGIGDTAVSNSVYLNL